MNRKNWFWLGGGIIAVLALAILMEIMAQRAQHQSDDTFVIHSATLNEDRPILVHLPVSYASDTARSYPILLALDGTSHDVTLKMILKTLAAEDKRAETIVVGIPNTDRNRDLTPPGFRQDEEGLRELDGQGDAFLSFLTTELLLELNSRYRTNGELAISGHSRAGLFVVYALTERPETFSAGLAFSPALWREERRMETLFKAAMDSQKQIPPLYLSIGERENDKMRKAYASFIKRLEVAGATSSLSYESYVTPGATHPNNVVRSAECVCRRWRGLEGRDNCLK